MLHFYSYFLLSMMCLFFFFSFRLLCIIHLVLATGLQIWLTYHCTNELLPI